jgi:hypothetical protein
MVEDIYCILLSFKAGQCMFVLCVPMEDSCVINILHIHIVKSKL